MLAGRSIDTMYTQPLKTLTEQQRAARFTNVAQTALPDFGLTQSSIDLIQDFVNASFCIKQSDVQWYLKLYNPTRHTTDAIESELFFVEALTETGFPAPRPLRSLNNQLVWTLAEGQYPEEYRIGIFSWVNGEMLQHEKKAEHYRNTGIMLAQLHYFSTTWPGSKELTRPNWNSEGVYGNSGPAGMDVQRAWENVSNELRSDLILTRESLQQAEASMGDGSDRYGLIHGDASFGNILFEKSQPTLIDFDDCGFGHYIFDLAVVLAGAWAKPGYPENRSALLEGYRSVRRLSDLEMNALPAAMAARAASMIFWAAAQSPDHSWINGQWERIREYMSS